MYLIPVILTEMPVSDGISDGNMSHSDWIAETSSVFGSRRRILPFFGVFARHLFFPEKARVLAAAFLTYLPKQGGEKESPKQLTHSFRSHTQCPQKLRCVVGRGGYKVNSLALSAKISFESWGRLPARLQKSVNGSLSSVQPRDRAYLSLSTLSIHTTTTW